MDYDVLVTGSSGHLGCALMLELSRYGYSPLGVDILPSETTTIVGKIQDGDLVKKILDEHPIRHIVHSATLHKPHVDSHPRSDFVETNITGTLVLLEAAAALPASRIESFVFISTTSTFGRALAPKQGQPAAWIDESVTPIPKNIYGITKCAAEDLCKLVHEQTRLPVVILRTSRFFPEGDDDEDRRTSMSDANLKVCELAYRRVDIEDVVLAVTCAMDQARKVQFGKFIISAPPPFNVEGTNREQLLEALDKDAATAIQQCVSESRAVFDKLGWSFLPRIDRVYCSTAAVETLGWKPRWTFAAAVDRIAQNQDWRSELTYRVGQRGYHDKATGVYSTRDRDSTVAGTAEQRLS